MRYREIDELRRAGEQRYRDLRGTRCRRSSGPRRRAASSSTAIGAGTNVRGSTSPRPHRVGWSAVLHPEDLAAFEERWEKGLKMGDPWEGESPFRGPRATGLQLGTSSASWQHASTIKAADRGLAP